MLISSASDDKENIAQYAYSINTHNAQCLNKRNINNQLQRKRNRRNMNDNNQFKAIKQIINNHLIFNKKLDAITMMLMSQCNQTKKVNMEQSSLCFSIINNSYTNNNANDEVRIDYFSFNAKPIPTKDNNNELLSLDDSYVVSSSNKSSTKTSINVNKFKINNKNRYDNNNSNIPSLLTKNEIALSMISYANNRNGKRIRHKSIEEYKDINTRIKEDNNTYIINNDTFQSDNTLSISTSPNMLKSTQIKGFNNITRDSKVGSDTNKAKKYYLNHYIKKHSEFINKKTNLKNQ